jgi:hypothetical protein
MLIQKFGLMKAFFTLVIAFLILISPLSAKKIEVNEARKVAKSFINQLDLIGKKPSDLSLVYISGDLQSPFAIQKMDETAYYYVFNFEGVEGYIVISADDAVVPVLAYSTQKNYKQDNQPDAFVKWMDKYRWEIKDIIDQQLPPGKEIEKQWERLRAGFPYAEEKNSPVVNPLITTIWDQMDYYHDLCPYDNEYQQRVATGCVATAMAQIMKYHNYPENGEGYHTYNHSKYGSLSANFGAQTYNWSAMPNQVTSSNTHVATLMYHCGVSLEMNYGPAQEGGSSTGSLDVVANALKSYFSYSTSTTFTMRSSYTDANWINLCKNELNNNRPMEYAGVGQGGGHAFVCDGYDANNYFHFNWGWSGYYDGYFYLDNLNPGTGGTGSGASNYNQYQQIVYGIEPEAGGGGGSTPGEGSPLELYSYVTVNPSPIEFFSSFSVSAAVLNQSGANYTGDYTVAIFNSDGANVGLVETLSGTLETGFYYNLTFTTAGLPITPGQYTLGIYSKKPGEDWSAIKNGSYNNQVSITINGPSNSIQMYSVAQMNPNPIIQGEPLTITANIANFGNNYNGTVSADLYNAQGEYEALVQDMSASYDGGYYYTENFSTSSVNPEPGTYILAFWEQATGGNWNLIGSTNDFPNPITVKIVAPGIQADPYENNDTEANAYDFSASNGVHQLTNGSNTHVGTDYDYYQFNLDAGYKYEVTARVHDSYNSGNGNTYTNDVIFSYNEGNGAGVGYDSQAPSIIVVNGKPSIKFFVAPYFVGQTGTYLLDVNIEKKGPAGIEDLVANHRVSLYPNPANNKLFIEIEDNASLNISEISIYNSLGQLVMPIQPNASLTSPLAIDISDLDSGVYFVRFTDDEGSTALKFNVVK